MTTPFDTNQPRPVQPTIPPNLSGVVESSSLASTLTTSNSAFSAAATSATSAVAPEVKVRGKLLKLMISMLFANIGIFMIWGAVPGILLPLQVQGIVGDSNKAGALALVATIGAFAAMLAQPVAGMVSDRTRSRFGRRAP